MPKASSLDQGAPVTRATFSSMGNGSMGWDTKPWVTTALTTGAIPIDMSRGNKWALGTLTGTITITITNPLPADVLVLRVVPGGHTINWAAGTKWVGGAAPTPSAGSTVDLYTFVLDSDGTTWLGQYAQAFA